MDRLPDHQLGMAQAFLALLSDPVIAPTLHTFGLAAPPPPPPPQRYDLSYDDSRR
ncbi:MAG: hypothetical protein SFV54_00885 [Bryobacteraceae bacterium]|nr:hypothetical protein [Bryobacteraceae bacterium]